MSNNKKCRFHMDCPNYYPCYTCHTDNEAVLYCGIAKEKMKLGV